MRIPLLRLLYWFGLSLGLLLALATRVDALTPYPPPTTDNSRIGGGTLNLISGEAGTTIARVTAVPASAPPTVVSMSQQIDDDSLDLLIVFRIDGALPVAAPYTADVNLGVLPASVKRVRFLSRTLEAVERPVVLQAEAMVSESCLKFAPGLQLSVTERETIRVPIRSTLDVAPVRALRIITTPTRRIDVFVSTDLANDECPADNAPADRSFEIAIPGKAPGVYTLRLLHHSGKVAAAATLRVNSAGTIAYVQSLELRGRGSYFLTASHDDVLRLLALTGPNQEVVWTLADAAFVGWAANSAAPANAAAVCRLFNSRAVTHFYSARQDECAALKRNPDWVDEGIAFHTLLPVNGACPESSSPVYRLFNSALANHRYTLGADTYATLAAGAWTGEGVAFCSPNPAATP